MKKWLTLSYVWTKRVITKRYIRKKRISFAYNVKLKILHAALLLSTQETSMMHTNDGEWLFTFTEHKWFDNVGASCYIINDDTRIHEVTFFFNWCKAAWAKWMLQKRVSFVQSWDRSMVANWCTLYGLSSNVKGLARTCFLWLLTFSW